ncbi:DUF2306 domain-containing protein [Cognatishimia sp.]|uniref:DUF2306 domain-containing protein n=1 Tax=Cognatishimia sp. TaxID=2211648 RepID=UPI003513CE5F|nr:DUF2306 domain-containing protein [Cognatishimia sp.]
MSINPILDASCAIKVHTLAASFALTLGPFIFTPKARGKLHKTLGYIWIFAMATTAISSFFIHSFQLFWVFSPIHFLSIFVLFGLCRAFWFIRNGNVTGHARTMLGMYWYGVIAAGIFTLLPGRMLNRAFFPETPWLGYVVIAFGSLLIIRHIRRQTAGLIG